MKIIRNKVLIDLKTKKEEYMLVNILFGLVDVISKKEAQLLIRWENEESIILQNDEEQAFYNALLHRNYIMDREKENSLRLVVL